MKIQLRSGVFGICAVVSAAVCVADVPKTRTHDPDRSVQSTGANESTGPATRESRRGAKKVFRPVQVGTLTLLDQKTYTEAVIVAESPLHVTVRHTSGVAQVEKGKLPEELYQRFPPDEEAAERDEAKAEANRAKAEADLRRRASDARARQEQAASRNAAIAAEQENAAARQASQLEMIRARATTEFYNHFRRTWRPGSNSIYITRLRVDVFEVEPSQGWEGTYNVKGHVDMEYYLSPGRTFNSMTRDFSGTYTERSGKREVSVDIR